MTQENFLLYEGGGVVGLEDGFGLFLESSFVGTLIENPFASTDAPTHKNACERSGFRAYSYELVEEPYTGRMVLKEFKDFDHDDRQHKHSHRDDKEPKSVEQEDIFITVAITVDDL